MVYNRYEDTIELDRPGFDSWFDDNTKYDVVLVDDMLPQIVASGNAYHGYNGIGPDWHFGYTGMGVM